MKTHEVSFIVIGQVLAFPLDMLRYDACFPADQASVAEIDASMDVADRIARRRGTSQIASPDGKVPLGLYRVRLLYRGTSKTWQPTSARWFSFGWQVDKASIKRGTL